MVYLCQIIDDVMTNRELCEPCWKALEAQLPKGWSLESFAEMRSPPTKVERPPDCPSEVFITDPIFVRDLALLLHLQAFQVIKMLIEQRLFLKADSLVDFAAASCLCTQLGVTAKKAL